MTRYENPVQEKVSRIYIHSSRVLSQMQANIPPTALPQQKCDLGTFHRQHLGLDRDEVSCCNGWPVSICQPRAPCACGR